jgi:hypothetical protein
MMEEKAGDPDLCLIRLGASEPSEEASSKSSVRGDGGVSDQGWNVGCSDEDSGDDLGVDPLGINLTATTTPIGVAIDVTEATLQPISHPIVTDIQKGKVVDVILTPNDLVVCNKGDEIQIFCQNKEGDQDLRSICVEKELENDVGRLCQGEFLSCEENSDSCIQVTCLEKEEDTLALSLPLEPFGPLALGPFSSKDKGKTISISFPIFFGGSSLGACGPPNSSVDPEYGLVHILNNKEVAFLAWQESNFAAPCLSGSAPALVPLSKPCRKKVEGRKNPMVENVVLPKCERFGQAVRGGKGGRRGRKKGRKLVSVVRNSELEDFISNESQDLASNLVGGNRRMVPISSLHVVLTEGESNRIHDVGSTAYRIEAERLFNTGVNLGCTTNEERISMIDRLIDLEEKEDNVVEVFGEDEVDQ